MALDAPEIFRHFEPYGGLADFTQTDEDIKIFWQLPVRYLSDALTPARLSRERLSEEFPNHVGLVNNGSFNAAIRHEENAVAAAIFAGVPMIALQACRLFALRMDQATGLPLCNEDGHLIVFPDRIPLPTIWSIGDDPAAQAFEDLMQFEQQTDTLNNDLALFMFDLAMRYVAMHECMHFVLGHARYCQVNLGMDVFEDGTARRGGIDPLTNQTLEFIADRNVVAGLAVDLDEGRLYHEWSRELPPGLAVEPEAWRRRVLFSTLALISRLWRNHGARTLADFSQPYPHPYERVSWMLSSLLEVEKGKHHQHSLLAFALAVGALDRNFDTLRQDIPILSRDATLTELTGFSSLDHGYSVVRAQAGRIQDKLHREFGPVYATGQDS